MAFDAYDGTTGGLSAEKIAEILERTKHWPPERKKAVKNYLEAAAVRENIKKRYDSPAAIAKAVDPDFVRTPAINLISDAIEKGPLAGRRRNLIVSMPPQEGKSTLCAVWTPIRAWQLNPNRRIIIATYGEDLALQHSTACRGWLEQHGSGVTDPLTGTAVEDKLGLRISTKSRRMDSWRIDGARGGLTAVGLGGSITGRPADLFIIDDPYKNMMEADSETHREKVDDWMRTVAKTRLSPEASMILIQCMTGDTPVLRPDGTETPLRDIRPGDRIATYEGGIIGTSFVRNHTSQGLDSVYRIKMKSGVTVRANVRHPFLVVNEDGTESWVKLGQLQPGDRLRAATGRGKRARLRAAMSRCRAKVCAALATTGRTGHGDTTDPHQSNTERATSSTATASPPRSTTPVSGLRAVSARVAGNRRPSSTCPSTGTASSASTMTMTRERSAACSATTATSWSDTRGRRSAFETGPTTSTDTIVSIDRLGVEEVFDIEVAGTENFIANGLVSHNTRWHKDDLAGRTIEAERALPAEFRSWRLINIPAISQEGIEDALGREPGVAMVSARGRDKREFEQTQREVGQRFWLAMYQGSPTDPEGGLFSRSWFNPKVEELPQYPVAAVVGIDPADSGEGDDTGIIGGILTGTGDIILTKDRSGLMTSDKWAREGVILALEIGAREIVIEGYAVFKTYRNVVIGAWNDIAQECREKLARDEPLEPWEKRALVPSMPFLVTKYDETGDAEGRASLLRKDFERKRAKVVQYEMAEFEEQAGDWQTGQHCPDRVSAAVVTHWRLNKLGAGRVEYGHPLQQRNLNAPPSRLTRRISDPRPGSPFRGGRFGR